MIEDGVALANAAEGRSESRVRLGMPDDYLTLFGRALLDRFVPRHPNVSLTFRHDFSHRLGDRDTRDLDIAIVTKACPGWKGGG